MLLTSFLSFSCRQPKTGRCGHKFTAHQMQPLYYITAFRWNQVIFAVFLKSLRQKWNKSYDRPILPPIWLFRQGHLSSWKIPDPWERWRKKWYLLLSLRSFLFSARKTPDSSYIYQYRRTSREASLTNWQSKTPSPGRTALSAVWAELRLCRPESDIRILKLKK